MQATHTPAPSSSDLIPTVPPRLLYPKAEAAILLGISERSIDYLISSGRLKTKRIGKRNLIPADELRRFVRADRPEQIRTQ
jgi:excisionase family DNA binding protein